MDLRGTPSTRKAVLLFLEASGSIERDHHRRPLSKFPEDFSERTAEASDRDHVLV